MNWLSSSLNKNNKFLNLENIFWNDTSQLMNQMKPKYDETIVILQIT